MIPPEHTLSTFTRYIRDVTPCPTDKSVLQGLSYIFIWVHKTTRSPFTIKSLNVIVHGTCRRGQPSMWSGHIAGSWRLTLLIRLGESKESNHSHLLLGHLPRQSLGHGLECIHPHLNPSLADEEDFLPLAPAQRRSQLAL